MEELGVVYETEPGLEPSNGDVENDAGAEQTETTHEAPAEAKDFKSDTPVASVSTSYSTYSQPGAQQAPDDDGSAPPGKLFVGGISWDTTEEGLSNHFKKYGVLVDVALMKDKYTGQPRGFGFVTFEDARAIDAVLADTHALDGRTVEVKRAVPRDKAPGPISEQGRATQDSAGRANSESKKIFVGGLASSIMDQDFKEYFEAYGKVVDAIVMIDRDTQRSRGFGFVTFEEEGAVAEVLSKNHEIHGKAVEIKRAEPKESRSGGRRGGSSSYGGGQSGGYGGYGYGGYGGGGAGGYGGYGGYPPRGYGGGGGYGGYGGYPPPTAYSGYGYGGYGGRGQYGGYGGGGYGYGGYGNYGGPGGEQGPGAGEQGQEGSEDQGQEGKSSNYENQEEQYDNRGGYGNGYGGGYGGGGGYRHNQGSRSDRYRPY